MLMLHPGCARPSCLLLVARSRASASTRNISAAVLFRLGRLGAMKGPGWYWLIPFVDRVVRVDMRTITYQLETQETITRDGVAVRVNAVLWFRADSAVNVVTVGRKLDVGDGPGGGDRAARRDRPERARPHAQGPAGDQQAHAGIAVAPRR